MADAHNHHFVPQGYLRAFAAGVKRQARIVVIDRVERKVFRTQVRNIGARRDFNRVEVEGVDPNVLEKAFADIEGPAASALQRIQASQSFAVAEDRLLVLRLIALLSGRNPRIRGRMGKFMRDIAQATAEMMVSSKEGWENIRTQAYASRSEMADIPAISYDEMKDFVRSKKYEIIPNKTFQIGLELGGVDTILQALVPRKWTLLVSGDNAGDFVTSDHPVYLLDASSRPSGPIFGVGFGMSDTAVLFPVSRNLLLCGRFEGTEGVLTAASIDVAQLNSQIIQRAERQVYAHDQTFKYFRPSGMAEGSHLIHDELFTNPRRE